MSDHLLVEIATLPSIRCDRADGQVRIHTRGNCPWQLP
jgi:hypothetical protein